MPSPRAARRRPGATVIDLAQPCARWRAALPAAGTLATAAARAVLAAAPERPQAPAPMGACELSLVLGDDALVRGLNRSWRGRDAPTNVLSFASGEHNAGDRPLLLGDIVLAYETVAREAAEQKKSLADHLRHLVVHGMLHLLGFDHEDDAEAERMEALERRILARLGVADPYRERADG